jgi:hypothetical protein
MGKFGWSYPPGCSGPPEPDYGPCGCCGRELDECICPECPECGATGDPACYVNHGLEYTKDQLEGVRELIDSNANPIPADPEPEHECPVEAGFDDTEIPY